MSVNNNPIEAILNEHPLVILDGALATELESHGCNLDDPLWSARVLLERPELIYRVHYDYFEAGADCAITASYQATVPGFLKNGIEEERALELIAETVELAKKARDDFWEKNQGGNRPKPLVAASVGPYGAYLADGSEYVGNYGQEDSVLERFHRKRLQTLIRAGADVLAFETIPSFQEAKVLSGLLEEFPDTYAWLSFSLRDGEAISDGTPLEECAAYFNGNEQIAAIGVNCASVPKAAKAVEVLSRHTEKPVVIYPNSGESYDPSTKTWSGEGGGCSFTEQSAEWYRAGARLIGGCCRTTPEHVRQIADKWRQP